MWGYRCTDDKEVSDGGGLRGYRCTDDKRVSDGGGCGGVNVQMTRR